MDCKTLGRYWCRVILTLVSIAICVTSAGAVESSVVGTLPLILKAEEMLPSTMSQTSLGGATADAALIGTQADVAIIPGEDIYANLLPGEVTQDELEKSLINNRELYLISVTPVQLKELLESGVAQIVLDEDTHTIDQAKSPFAGFPQIGGFSFTYDVSAPAGQRVVEISLDSGEDFELTDQERQLTLVAPYSILDGTYDGYSKLEGAKASGMTEVDALARLIQSNTLNGKYDGTSRSRSRGSADTSLASTYHLGLLALVSMGILLWVGTRQRMLRD